MENPAQLIRRARLNRRRVPPRQETQSQPLEPRRFETPAPVSHHASYTALMRSHDRVRTRHTGVKA